MTEAISQHIGGIEIAALPPVARNDKLTIKQRRAAIRNKGIYYTVLIEYSYQFFTLPS
jgi:hypothetical protein